jgi:hypothetical protein
LQEREEQAGAGQNTHAFWIVQTASRAEERYTRIRAESG